MQDQYSFAGTLAAQERIRWRVEDLIGGEKRLDFSRPFLPESLAQVEPLTWLWPEQRRTLNQIRAHAYLCLFGVIEEFIVPFVLDHVRSRLEGDTAEVRALLQFAGEEAKHIDLFKRFRSAFAAESGLACEVIGPGPAIAKAVLAHQPLAVALAILHIEWMTQRHYVESVKDDAGLDDCFASLLKHHWMEEAQHAKLDTLIVGALAANRSPSEIMAAVEEYLEIGGFIDEGLRQQVELDLDALMRATGAELSVCEWNEAIAAQRKANRWTYLGSGMTHPSFLATLGALSPAARERVEQVAPSFC
jgi:hypothetical protein